VTWHAPAVLYSICAGDPGTPRDACTLLPSLHAFTPETPDTTHYVWATGGISRWETRPSQRACARRWNML
jgi:hypothetical protein